MSDGTDKDSHDDLTELKRSLADLTARLGDIAVQVDELARRQATPPATPEPAVAPPPGSAAPAGPAASTGLTAAATLEQLPSLPPTSQVPPTFQVPATSPLPAATAPHPYPSATAPPWPVPPGAVGGDAPRSQGSTGGPGGSWAGRGPGPVASPLMSTWAAAPGPRAEVGGASPAATRNDHTTWADTAGLKVLGWVGGGVTVLGIVLLLVIAAQQGILGPLARVLIGLVLGAVLIGTAALLHRRPTHVTLAVTVGCTGLAVEYLTVIGAVRLVDLVPPLVGHVASALIVAVAVGMAAAWREPWLAGASFAVSGLLAPAVGGDFSAGVLGFEAIMVAGAAACLLLGLGLLAWAGASIAALFAFFMAMAIGALTPAGLVVTVVVVGIGWAVFLGRWVADAAPIDPGPFPVRPRSFDPEQIARDYHDFHAHNRRRDEAHAYTVGATLTLSVAAGLLAVALVVVEPGGVRDSTAGLIASVLTVLFAIVAWASGRHPALVHTSSRVIAWCATIALAAVALLRLLSGDARSVSWVILATLVLAVVALERLSWLLAAALAAAGVALIAAGPAMAPTDLLSWPADGLVVDGALLTRAWTVVLPAGICVIAMCLAAWWAVARVTAARLATVRAARHVTDGGGSSPDEVVTAERHRAIAERHRTTVMGWTLVGCSAVACYGLLAMTMVLTYAVSPTYPGYQGGQIIVTAFVTLLALALLWQGFRRLVVRLGGLGLAAVAVAKLLLFDTRSLEALPRAITVIGVGVLLLLGAIAYLTTLSRVRAEPAAGVRTLSGPRVPDGTS